MKKPINLVMVKMLVDTAYQGPRKAGDEVRVPEDFAKRWVKNGIAELVHESEILVEEAVEEPVAEEPVVEEGTAAEGTSYEGMSAKDLYALCKEKGLDVEAKKSKEYYIEKLG